MPQELIQLDTRKRQTKITLIILIVLASVWSYFAVRWYIGNTMAEYFNTGQNNLDLAQVARNLAPSDPLTHWRLGQVSQKRLPLDQSAVALAEYERAVSLSPNDFRLWVSLGTARAQSGDDAGAEQALRQGIALAPSYAYPHWYLGNLLLRSARYDEAFAELQKASDAAPIELRPQLFNLVWQVYSSDVESMKKAVGSNAEARSQFTLYLFSQQKFEDGLKFWGSLTNEEKKANKSTGDSILAALIANHRFHDAVVLWNDLAPNANYRVEEGRITDGSFEEPINYTPEMVFGWQVKNAPQMEIGIDPAVSHNGSRSLRLFFQVRAQLESLNAAQLVPIAKNAEYDFECFVRTAKLQSGATPYVEIVDTSNGAILAASPGAPNGDNDWTRIGLTFKTGEKTEGIAIRINRGNCGEEIKICPIFGALWYDDFSIKRRN
jgi:hypothetical protein